jgi:serine protease Do
MIRLIFLLTWFFAIPLAAQSVLPDTSDLYDNWRDRVVQVQVIDQQAQSKAGIGSGFFAGKPGWVVTNYHVIADLANQPGRYLAQYLAEDGTEGRLELLSVDVVHDLAILRAENLAPPALQLAVTEPPKGSRLYSLGYPYDIGLTIVEGTYNGMLEKSLYEKLHFTGSINPGMSGGPTLNQAGEVVGINVSTAGNQVSFLVPVVFADRLVQNTQNEVADPDLLNAAITLQLLGNQQAISSSLLDNEVPQTPLNHYFVPGALAPWVNCWGNSQEGRPDELALVYYRCQTQDDIFLSRSLNTGVIQYQHDLLSTDHLHPMRFYHQLESRSHYPQLRLEGDKQTVTNYECQSDFIEQSGISFKATFCVRRYRDFEGLYDSYLSLTSLVDDRESLQSTMILAGFSWVNIRKLNSRFIETMSLDVTGS